MTSEEFYEQIASLSGKYDNIDLEVYLRTLYRKVMENKNNELTYDLVITMIRESFTDDPVAFEEDWLKCSNAPDENRISKKFTNPDISSSINKENTSALEPFNFTIEVLKFQIAELHKMKGKQLDDKYRYFGIDSETGNRWYNFDPFTNLECGARCMEDNDADFGFLDWSFLGELLENGRIYE